MTRPNLAALAVLLLLAACDHNPPVAPGGQDIGHTNPEAGASGRGH